MKGLSVAATILTFALLLASAGKLFAGVVMAETSRATGPDGAITSQNKTIYVQGNKQRVEREGVAAITDLDKSVLYIIDKHDRAYAAMPLRTLSQSLPGDTPGATVKLNRTGETRVIADHPCNEYRASEGDKLERVTISACVSTNAPGAKEVSEFEQKMIARLNGDASERSSGHEAAGLMLEKQSIVSFRMPDPSRRRPYRTASLLAETRINKIQLKPLPPETFKPPKGFNELRNGPREAVPAASPYSPGHTIEVIAPSALGAARPSGL